MGARYHAVMPGPEPLIDVRLTDHPVEPESLAGGPGAGAECVFLGRTRSDTHPDHGVLRQLRYEAYRPMAERVLRGLASEAADRFGCLAVRIHHAVGAVDVGKASVLIQVLTGHRAKAFEACRFLIDRVKVEAPIWKRQEWATGTTWSPGGAAAPRSAEPVSRTSTP